MAETLTVANSQRQGIWDFESFEGYLLKWIRPHTLADLDTVFEGAAVLWNSAGQPKHGRGDFILATAFFAVLDHLGQFFAADDEVLQTVSNIFRMVDRLPSTKPVAEIVARFARNALIHGAWPQTVCWPLKQPHAFGLSLSADPSLIDLDGESTHDNVYYRYYDLPLLNGTTAPDNVLKLRLNVQVLRRELREVFATDRVIETVSATAFRRVVRYQAAMAHGEIKTALQVSAGAKVISDERLAMQLEALRARAKRPK
jgi:hypothetical protein